MMIGERTGVIGTNGVPGLRIAKRLTGNRD